MSRYISQNNPERLARLTDKYVNQNMSLRSIADEEVPKISQERVRQILTSAGVTMRKSGRNITVRKRNSWHFDLVCQFDECKKEFVVNDPGKIRKFCSTKCRYMSIRPKEYRHMSKSQWQAFNNSLIWKRMEQKRKEKGELTYRDRIMKEQSGIIIDEPTQ